MKVLSLCDGISCFQVALEKAGIHIDVYYASEIDKYAIEITQKNYPNTIQLGDVTKIDFTQFIGKIDIIGAGTPCQDLSIAGKRAGLEGERSALFYKFVEALEVIKPKYFLFENVASMKQSDKDIITNLLKVEPILINSALVSAQDRKRLYWTNIPNVTQPEDKHIYLEDIVEPDVLVDRDKSHAILASIGRTTHREYFKKNQGQVVIYQLPRGNNKGGFKIYKTPTITTSSWEFNNLIAYKLNKLDLSEGEYTIRKVTPLECERLQTLPEGYTEGISNTQRYKCIGNGWTVDVITHILRGINGINI